MAQKANNQGKLINITYSKEEAAKLFSCLSPEIQDEILSIMRDMVKLNQTAQA